MSNYRAGDVIRLTRIASGISQETLSEGICSVQTLHRIENGKTRVKKELYQQLMAKMEREPQKNYAVCVGKDMELLEERIFFEEAMSMYDYESAEKYFQILKEKADDNMITNQYMLKAKTLIDYYQHRIDEKQMINQLEEALRITLPEYEKCMEQEYPFTEQEIMNLMSLANAYSYTKKYDKAINILCKLLKTLDMDYIVGEYVLHMKLIILRNMAIANAELKKYNEALILYDECVRIAKEMNNGRMICIIYADKACSMLRQIEMGKRNKADVVIAKKYLRQSYYFSVARNDKIIADITKKAYKKEFRCKN